MAEGKLALRVKSKKCQNAVLRDVSITQPIQEFLDTLASMTDVPADRMAILTGFPPKRVNFHRLDTLETLGLRNQDTVIVELDTEKTEAAPAATAQDQLLIKALNAPTLRGVAAEVHDALGGPSEGGMLMRHTVPSDNSCLFTSISFCLYDGEMEGMEDKGGSRMRALCAHHVESDIERFNEAILGRPNQEYVNWIQKTDSWGGGIELSILSEQSEMEIAVVDIQSLHISRFGEDKNYPRRMFLLYDGLHYDPLYWDPLDGSKITTVFSTSDEAMLEKALQLGKEAKAAHQYTDVANFSLKCGVCYQLLKGQTEAQLHAKETGHMNFSEVTK